MLKIKHVHKSAALKTLVDQHDASAVVTNHFHLASVLAEEHEQIAIHKLCTHLLAHK